MTFIRIALFFKLIFCFFVLTYQQQQSLSCKFEYSSANNKYKFNFSRLSHQQTWTASDGNKTVFISMCSAPGKASPCHQGASCVIFAEHKAWHIVVTNIGSRIRDSRHNPERPVLEVDSLLLCKPGMNFSAEVHFTCSELDGVPVLLDVRDQCTPVLMWQTPTACPVIENCAVNDMDFSSLQRHDYYNVSVGGRRRFLMNLCGRVSSEPCADKSACEINYKNETVVIGQYEGHRVQLISSVPTLIYKNKDLVTHVQFICNMSVTTTSPKFLQQNGKLYLFEVETPLACRSWPQDCVVRNRVDGHIDLSPLRKIRGNWVTQPSPSGVRYHINVCGPLNSEPNLTCADDTVGACQTGGKSSISLGMSNSGPQLSGAFVTLQYTGGSPCGDGSRHSAKIEFSCSKQDKAPVLLEVTPQCVHLFSWETTAACPVMVTSGNNCVVTEMRYGHVFDVNPLRKAPDGYTLTTQDSDMYNINVCGKLNTACNNKNASVCLTTKDRKQYAIGFENSTVLYDNGGLRFVLRGEGCRQGKNSSTVTIILLCRHGNDIGEPVLYPQDGDCNFYFVWYTHVTCPPHNEVKDCTVTRGKQFYDLGLLTEIATNHVVVPEQSSTSKLKFLLNICHSVVFGHESSCQYSSGACIVNMSDPHPGRRFINIGDVGGSPYFEDGKLKLKYNNGDMCSDPSGPDHMSTTITFECDYKSVSTGPELLTGNVCEYQFLWRTRAACPVGKQEEDDTCTLSVPGVNKKIDLRPLKNKVVTVSDSEGHNYTFVVCGNLLNSSCRGPVGICQTKSGNPSHSLNAGVGNSRLHYSVGAISLDYEDGDGEACSNGVRRSTRIEFVCSVSEQIVFTDESQKCSYIINWHTPLACSREYNCSAPTRRGTVDLSPLISMKDNYNITLPNGTVFYINVCAPLLPVRGLSCPGGSSACIARLQNGSLVDEKSLGIATTPKYLLNGTTAMKYIEGSGCPSGGNFSTNISFECHPKSGKGMPEFEGVDECAYIFLWKTSVTCEPYNKKVSLRPGACYFTNEQTDTVVKLSALGPREAKASIHRYGVDVCGSVHTSDNVMYGTLSNVVFNYQRLEARLIFTDGDKCSSDEKFGSEVLMHCNEHVGIGEPKVLEENDCGVIIEWTNTPICAAFYPGNWIPPLEEFDNRPGNISVGLTVGLVVVAALIAFLVIFFRKPANRSIVRSKMSSMFGMRHSGRFHYSRLEAADEASQLLASHADGQESDSDDELLRM